MIQAACFQKNNTDYSIKNNTDDKIKILKKKVKKIVEEKIRTQGKVVAIVRKKQKT